MKYNHAPFLRTTCLSLLCLVISSPLPVIASNTSVIVTTRVCRTCNNNATDVKNLQIGLSQLGYYQGPVSGRMGAATEQALKNFQSANGIAPSGATGPNTRAALADPLGSFITKTVESKGSQIQSNQVIYDDNGNPLQGDQLTAAQPTFSSALPSFVRSIFFGDRQDPTKVPVEDRTVANGGVKVVGQNISNNSNNTQQQNTQKTLDARTRDEHAEDEMDPLGDFANQAVVAQTKREAVVNSLNSRKIDTNAGEAEARRVEVYREAQKTAAEQPSSWGRETRTSGDQTVTDTGLVSNEVCSRSILCSVFGKTAYQSVFGNQSTSPVKVEDRVATPVNSNQNNNSQLNDTTGVNYGNEGRNAGEPAMHTPEPSYNTRIEVTLPAVTITGNANSGPNYSHEGRATDQGSVMNTPEPNHPADVNYGNGGNSYTSTQVGNVNYGNEGNNYAPTQVNNVNYSNEGRNDPAPTPTNSSAFSNGRGEGNYFYNTGYGESSRTGGGEAGTCFIAGTKIMMSDLSFKNIEEVIPGDKVMSQEGPSVVTARMKFFHNGDIYAYNNSGKYFFTPNHPFMTKQGWRSFEPSMSMKETPVIIVSTTTVGDVLVKYGSQEKVLSYQKKHMEGFVYNFTVAGSHTYYANGYLVHNLKDVGSGGGGDNWGGYEDIEW